MKSRKQKWIENLSKQLEEEKAKATGYMELAKVNGAYISILLNKLGATKDNTINITLEDVKETMAKYETKAVKVDGGYGLYCEVIEK